jgi:hypothetical protein
MLGWMTVEGSRPIPSPMTAIPTPASQPEGAVA